MTIAAAALITALLCWPVRRRASTRLAISSVQRVSSAPVALRRPIAVAAALSVVGFLLIGGPWWLAAILALMGCAGSRARTVPGPGPDEVAVTADLMAACLNAGAPIADALAAALVAAGPWLRARGEPVVASLRSGSPPDGAWQDWLDDLRLAPLARTCIRTSGSGAGAAAELIRVAARMRAAAQAARQHRVARASIWIVLPLGSCFLPAFVAVGVVPLVISLIERLH